MKKIIAIAVVIIAVFMGLTAVSCSEPEELTRLSAAKNFRLEGRTVIWDEVEHADGYDVVLNDRETQITEARLTLPDDLLPGEYTIEVLAFGTHYKDSRWAKYSFIIEKVKLASPQNVGKQENKIIWDEVEHAEGYIVTFLEKEINVIEPSCTLLNNLPIGKYTIYVRAYGNSEIYTDSDNTEYKFSIDGIVQKGYDENGFLFTLLSDESGYEVQQGKANLEGVVTIPQYFCGLPVKRIVDYGFSPDLGGGAIYRDPFTGKLCNTATTEVIIPSTIKEIGMDAFAYMVNVEEFNIPDSVKSIKPAAFAGCVNLRRVHLPKGLKEIPNRCFYMCDMDKIEIPDGVETIGDDAFSCWNNLDYYYDYHAERCIPKRLKEVIIPDSVKSIGAGAFHAHTNLEKIKLPENLEYFGNMVFDYTKWYDSQPEGFVTLGNVLYEYKGEAPDSVTIPQEIKYIAAWAVSNKKTLKEVIIPDGVKLIGENIFIWNDSLTYVRLPSDLTVLPGECFMGCRNLAEIELPSTLKKIERFAFSWCPALNNVLLPDSLESIGEAAFAGCTSLESIVLPSGMESIGESAFAACSSLTSITLPDGLKRISRGAFGGCTSLESITFPDSVESIEYRAFRNCTSLKSIVLPDKIKTIEVDSFTGCTLLKSIVLPASITNINKRAFDNCTSLDTVFYKGNEDMWNTITIDSEKNDSLLNASKYYFNDSPIPDGKHWGFVDSLPTIWS